MRYLYVYDPDRKRFTETCDVSDMTVDDREMLRLEMMAAAEFPLEVMDSFEDGFPLTIPFGARLAEYVVKANDRSN